MPRGALSFGDEASPAGRDGDEPFISQGDQDAPGGAAADAELFREPGHARYLLARQQLTGLDAVAQHGRHAAVGRYCFPGHVIGA